MILFLLLILRLGIKKGSTLAIVKSKRWGIGWRGRGRTEMGRGDHHLSFNDDIYKEYGRLVGSRNITKSLQEYMIGYINSSKKTGGIVNKERLNKELKQARGQQIEANCKVQTLAAELSAIEKREEEVEIQQLKNQEEIIKKANSCIGCGGLIEKGQRGIALFEKGMAHIDCAKGNLKAKEWGKSLLREEYEAFSSMRADSVKKEEGKDENK